MNELSPDIERHEEDISWIQEFKGGNKEAFNWLVLKHKNRVFNVCYRFLGDYEEANDCAQEAFVKVYRSMETFKMESRFTTWLYRIAVNTCKNRVTSREYRQRKKNRTLDTGMEERLGDTGSSPEKNLQQKTHQQAIQNCLDKLAEDHRTVVVLRDVDGRAYDEISGMTGQTLGTVKSRLARARQQLRTCLQGIL
jgi:RNA polymerase sigma-70 factor (ECF subfamily)